MTRERLVAGAIGVGIGAIDVVVGSVTRGLFIVAAAALLALLPAPRLYENASTPSRGSRLRAITAVAVGACAAGAIALTASSEAVVVLATIVAAGGALFVGLGLALLRRYS